MSKELEALSKIGAIKIGVSNNEMLNHHVHDMVEYNTLLQALERLKKLENKIEEFYIKPERKNGFLESASSFFERAEKNDNRVIKELKELINGEEY